MHIGFMMSSPHIPMLWLCLGKAGCSQKNFRLIQQEQHWLKQQKSKKKLLATGQLLQCLSNFSLCDDDDGDDDDDDGDDGDADDDDDYYFGLSELDYMFHNDVADREEEGRAPPKDQNLPVQCCVILKSFCFCALTSITLS